MRERTKRFTRPAPGLSATTGLGVLLGAASLAFGGCGSADSGGPPATHESPAADASGSGSGSSGGGAHEDAGSGTGSGSGSSSGGTGSGSGSSSGGSSGGSSGSGSGSSSGAPAPDCKPGLPSSLDDLQSMTNGDTTSKITPMGVHYETPAKHVVTSAEQSFLDDPAQEPSIPSSTSGLHLQAMKVTLYPSSTGLPTPADINQHAIGNCDGDTASADMAYQNAAYLKTLITDDHDGTYTVAMFDPMAKPITVKLSSQFLVDSSGDIGAVSGKNGVADWATLLEKATMKYNQVYGVVDDIGGIGSEFQTPMFTGVGGSIAFGRGVLQPADLTRAVEASLAAGKIISGGFGTDGMALPSGLETVTAHGYAVLFPAQPSIMVSMRNPWGVDPTASGYDGSTDGVMDIPPDTTWSAQIDLRIIDPGASCGAGQAAPYVPAVVDVSSHQPVHIRERHARP